MKINGQKPPENQNVNQGAQGAQKVSKPDTKESTSRTGNRALIDKLDISDKAKEIAKLQTYLDQIPDVRMDKVKTIREAIDTGNYKVNASKIAEKMLNEL